MFLVELVGPAGAGKTTLSRALCQCSNKIVPGAEISLRKKDHLASAAYNALLLLPILLSRSVNSRFYTRDEIKAMIYLQGWSRVFRQQSEKTDAVILVDHGPIFKLAMLQAFGPERLKEPFAEQWWNDMCKQWALMLDIVIWLDAPDTTLRKRINIRDQRHAIKGKSELEGSQFLDRYRASYAQILEKLKANGGPRFYQFDTSQTSVEHLVEEIQIICNVKPSSL